MLALVNWGVHLIPLQPVHFILIRPVHLKVIWTVHLKVIWTVHLKCRNHLKAAESYITLDRARFLAGKIYQIDYVNPYNNKQMSVLLHTKEKPEVTELLNIISANC